MQRRKVLGDRLSFRRVLREPLLHFLLLGLALFLYYGRVAPDDDGGKRIVVSQAQADLLATQFQATWSRPPTADELQGLVESYVRDEILYREGRSLGLDQDDAVIKRRVRQKLDVMIEESIAQNPPTDADLQAYLDANPETFRKPPVVSFEQVYFGADGDVDAKLARARALLQQGADPATLGQPTLLPARQDDVPLDLVARDFGKEFADALAGLTVGEWSQPVSSGFGMHLVRLNALQPAQVPALDAVRDIVAREWENARRKRAQAAALAELRKKYEVEIQASLLQVTTP
jgi:hypothetical protein